ncbi:septal ring lytic transglycosylase RlpA family protein [Halomonas sp.]|uniref:septal ring lytic transglycosylase RlpA family protein n=1 Tax=Halomonas sp. TaxID=1486246 RepID=UPI00298E78D8|nr:septal ring lytic transglycosylase RlpA family protein [Halomonas sp.]MDW7746410.1 septal ring lytic transglycosylase RlpA family protein [Halomonas sp.]
MGIRSRLILTCCLTGLLMAGCAGKGQAHEKTAETQQGVASYYSDRFQGRTTASGEPFDQQALTAAHPTLPFGTRVVVTREDNGREVEVLINDRGPYAKGRIIDLSKRAAKALGMLSRGTAPVEISYVQ